MPIHSTRTGVNYLLHLATFGSWISIWCLSCSFYTFSKMPEVKEIVVVCDPSYRDIFEGQNMFLTKYLKTITHSNKYWIMYTENGLFAISFFVMLDSKDNIQVDLKFALPGKERQDSVYNGLEVCLLFSYMCIYEPYLFVYFPFNFLINNTEMDILLNCTGWNFYFKLPMLRFGLDN